MLCAASLQLQQTVTWRSGHDVLKCQSGSIGNFGQNSEAYIMKSNRSRSIAAATLVTLVIAAWSASASAQSTSGDDTQWVVSPYLWGTALSGTSTIGVLPPVEIDASFSDILSNLNFAMSLHTEYHNGRWAFVLDPMYV